MNKQQFLKITEWQDKTFPDATTMSKLWHLKEEMNELIDACIKNDPNLFYEFADCFMLLFGAAAKLGLSYEEICEWINMKFRINNERKWGNPDENGVVRHIPNTPNTKKE